MLIGDKIRNIRTLKGLSQENMAEMLALSAVAYGDIERNKKDVNMKRLEQIAGILGVSVNDILAFGDKVSNFFDQCNNTNVSSGPNGGTQIQNSFDEREYKHQLEKAQLEIEKLKIEKEKFELEVKYWKEKYENKV
jgi:XRE family transcriptional regulator, regulator of sulfur utilization